MTLFRKVFRAHDKEALNCAPQHADADAPETEIILPVVDPSSAGETADGIYLSADTGDHETGAPETYTVADDDETDWRLENLKSAFRSDDENDFDPKFAERDGDDILKGSEADFDLTSPADVFASQTADAAQSDGAEEFLDSMASKTGSAELQTQTPQDNTDDDVVAFARAQMRASELAQHADRAMPEPRPVVSSENEPADHDTAPAIDLSNGVDLTAETSTHPRPGRRVGRVKTRLLGFNRGEPESSDPFNIIQTDTAQPVHGKYPVGWLVIVNGPGTGHSFALFSGAAMIGRGEDQTIRLDFGDSSISRQSHAAIAYDDEQNQFFLGHGGKSNIIRRNGRPVLSTDDLHSGDLIRVGETTLRFVALCGKDFQWGNSSD
jgi:hypothetical protein